MPAIRSSSATRCSFPRPMGPAARCSKCARGLRRRLVRRRPAARQGHAGALEHAHLSRGLSVRLERPARLECRTALHRMGDRQGHVERAGFVALHAALCRRAFRLPDRARAAAVAQSQSATSMSRWCARYWPIKMGRSGPHNCSSIRPGRRRCCRTGCSTCAAKGGWFVWN